MDHKKYKKIAVGGTFDKFHDGHKKLLATAFELGEEVEIGVTSNAFGGLKGDIDSCEDRMRCLKEFFKDRLNYTVMVLDDAYGTTVFDDEFDAIVSKRQYKSHVGIIDTLKILIENAHNGKNNVPATKALKKVVIDDTINEISCAFNYLDYLKDNIKRLTQVKKYYDKMNSSNSEKQKNYYLEGMKMLFDKGETVENFEGILDEYKKALVDKETQIDKLNAELKEIRKLKI